MIVTEILGNVHDDAGATLVGDRHREQVHLEGSALVKRIQRCLLYTSPSPRD